MMTYIWALPALAGVLTGPGEASATVEPPVMPQAPVIEAIAPSLSHPATEILELDEERNRRFTVPVMIEGAGPFNFMIDTGSEATAVTHQINEGLQLKPSGTATLVGMASRRPVNIVEVDTMTFGNQTVYDFLSPVLDRQHVGADGILGLDNLQDFRVLFDFRDETIAVQNMTEQSSSTRGFEIVVRARQRLGQLLITSATVDGVKTTVIIDTGAQGSLGNLALEKRLRAKREEESIVHTDVNGVQLAGSWSIVRKLNIDGISLSNVPLAFADAPAFEALGLADEPVISLGMQHLRIFDRVAIDFANNRVLFDLPRKVAREIRRQKSQGLRTLGR